MDLEAASSDNMSKKKAPKDAFYGSTGGYFSQKKKVVSENIKHLGDKKDISLNKSELGDNMFSNVDSLFGDEKGANMTNINVGFLLDLAANTPKTKHINTGVIFGFSLSSSNFDINNNKEMKVLVRKSFALDINLSAVEGKLAMAKTQFTRNFFSIINGFGGATTFSKFEKIIRSTFISEESIKKTTLLARENEITVNSNFKKQRICSNQTVVIKEILMNMPKKIIIAMVSIFEEIKLIKIQLIGMWQKTNSVHVAIAMGDWDTWMSKDCFRALLFTLPIETTAYDLGTLLKRADEKTCVINHSLKTGNQICCTVIGFKSENELEFAFRTEPIFGGVRLSWTRLDLVWCERCGKFGHSALECDASDTLVSALSKNLKKNLTRLYAKKNVSISYSVVFSGKLWAQVFDSGSDSGFFSFSTSGLDGGSPLVLTNDLFLNICLASLKCSLELLNDQVSGIVHKINDMELVSLAPPFSSVHSVVSININLDLNLDMVLDGSMVVFILSSVVLALGFSSLRILMTKVNCLESKLVALKASIGSVLVKLDQLCAGSDDVIYWHRDINNLVSIFMESKLRGKVFTSGLKSGYLGASVVIIMNFSLTKHVYRVSKVPDWLLFIKLLFKNKLSVLILRLYTSASSVICFSQAGNINFLITKTVNESFFIIFGDDFNENSSHKCASFKKCLDLGLVNSLVGSLTIKEPTWANSKSVIKTINYVLVSPNLINVIMHYNISKVSKHFDIDYQFVSVSFKDANKTKWNAFKNVMLANAAMFSDEFATSTKFLDLNKFLRFYKLELLVSRIVKVLHEESDDIVDSNANSDHIHSVFFGAKRFYCATKLAESLKTKEANIRSAIDKRMESFEINKGYTIKNVLKCLFHKVVLDYLVINDKLILEPDLVKSKGESYQYLGIFLSNESLSKPSLAKAYSDIHFFTNLVLRKTVLDKQFLYLVLVVLYLIYDIAFVNQLHDSHDGFLKNLNTIGCKTGTAAFFEDINLGLDIGVLDLMSSTMAELQTIVLALECILLFSSVYLFSDSQSVLNAFEHQHIVNIIHSKNLRVSWHKVKSHLDILKNEHANMIAGAVFLSGWHLPPYLNKCFIVADDSIVSDNSKHFVCDVYHSICHACWEVGSGFKFLMGGLLSKVNWLHSSLHLYNKCYPSVLCLYCDNVEVSDYVFFCKKAFSGFSYSFLSVLQLLLSCVSDFSVSMALYKSFVFNSWFHKAVSIFHNPKVAGLKVVKFVYFLGLTFRNNARLILLNGLALVLVSGLALDFSAGMIKLLSITKAFGIHFGFHKSCLFFLNIGDLVLVYIVV
ncbi:hypothetical protein G9A89_014068 [Geosiphon pyriformis]|nr:hypothetical protein G9A89_014068 [Geosiphon pyriformis]